MLLAEALNAANIGVEATVYTNGWPEDDSVLDHADSILIYADAAADILSTASSIDSRLCRTEALAWSAFTTVLKFPKVRLAKPSSTGLAATSKPTGP